MNIMDISPAVKKFRISQSIAQVQKFKNIFLLLDSDEAGKEGTEKFKQFIQGKEIQEISLKDAKDLNELYQSDPSWARSFLAEATKSAVEKATMTLGSCVDSMIDYLSNERNTQGDSTGWLCIDKQLGGGLRPGEMTVLNAFAKTGKTSFLNNLIHNLAMQNKKIALASFEMDPARMIYPTLLSIAGRLNLRTITDQSELAEVIKAISTESPYLSNIFTLRRFGYTPWSEIEEWTRMMKDKHDIDYLVLDHAGFLVTKMADAEENQTLAKNVKRLTNELGIHIPIVVQAPKTKDGLSIQTAYGGLSWGMNCDNFFILERSKDNELELKVKLEAARYPGANPSNDAALLFYDRNTLRLEE